jgi:hypothetical protein
MSEKVLKIVRFAMPILQIAILVPEVVLLWHGVTPATLASAAFCLLCTFITLHVSLRP